MSRNYGITGTPGTGKKTVSRLVSKRLQIPCCSVNDLASRHGSVTKSTDALEVDTALLRRTLAATEITGPSILYGHLLPYSLPKGKVSRVVVLRCEPRELRRRLLLRGYAPEKVAENVEAELIGLISADAEKAFGRRHVWEVDTSGKQPAKTAEQVERIFRSGTEKRIPIDWLRSYSSAAELKSLLPGLDVSDFT